MKNLEFYMEFPKRFTIAETKSLQQLCSCVNDVVENHITIQYIC